MYKNRSTGLTLNIGEILKLKYDCIHINKSCNYVELWEGSVYTKFIKV